MNILLLDEASGIDMQPLVPSTKILQWQRGTELAMQGCGCHNHNNRRE
jgi:hypothetical protein